MQNCCYHDIVKGTIFTDTHHHQKFTQLPHQISNGSPLTTYIFFKKSYFCPTFLSDIAKKQSISKEINNAEHKYMNMSPPPPLIELAMPLLFYTFSYFIPTFPKILVLLLSYFSTQGYQKAWWWWWWWQRWWWWPKSQIVVPICKYIKLNVLLMNKANLDTIFSSHLICSSTNANLQYLEL
jgi:hypothetical protein